MSDQDVKRIEWRATRVFFDNMASRKGTVVNIGGARSSKSYSIVQLFISKFFTEKNKKFLTTRKTYPALRMTTYKDAIDRLHDYDLYSFVDHNKSEKTIRNRLNGNYWIFTSIDDPEKIKSTEFNYVHMEEGNEFTYDDYRIIKLRMSGSHGEGETNQIFVSMNPSDDQGWIRTKLLQFEDCDVIRSTYLDNPFIPESYVKELEALKDQDESYWKIYGLGEFAAVKEMIYGPMEIVAEFPVNTGEIFYGLDFGFNNPTVLLEIRSKDYFCWIRELIHESRMTNSDLIARMRQTIHPNYIKSPIYADASEPARIEEIARAGYNVHPAEKDVLAGILFVKRFKRYSLADNVETNREVRGYKWRVDRNGNVLDEPVKFEDHAPDALRYGLFSHLGVYADKGYYFHVSKNDVY